MIAQFAITSQLQFRMIGWTNVIVGILALLLQVVIFREKSRCKMTGWPANIKHHCLNFKLYNVRQIHWVGLLVSYGTKLILLCGME